MSEKIRCDALVVGAGVIGLAVAARLAQKTSHIIVVETHDGFGRETSSRNSEVIHSGIHYPAASLKTELCLLGQKALYAFARKNEIPFRQCGKFVVAVDEQEMQKLENLARHVRSLDVRFELLSANEITTREKNLSAQAALYFPDTGIIDSHSLMGVLESQITSRGGHVAYHHRVVGVQKRGGDWTVQLSSPSGDLEIVAAKVVNAAGLSAAQLSNLALGGSRYEHRFCRGRYFQLSSKYRNHFRHLVYPLPQAHGLGVHTTSDLEGFMKLGPDTDWCPDSDPARTVDYYRCDWDALRPQFAVAGRKLLPHLIDSELTPGMVGIRPKLYVDGQARPDFLVENQAGWIHCLGIESPGLTSALAIAEKVERLT